MMTRFFRGISPAREDNYIAGLSMGGYGALKAALTFPQRYAAACSLSGALDIPFMFDTYKVEGEAFYKSIFGSKEDFVGSTNDLFALLKKDAQNGVKLPEIFLSCGTSDRILPAAAGFTRNAGCSASLFPTRKLREITTGHSGGNRSNRLSAISAVKLKNKGGFAFAHLP